MRFHRGHIMCGPPRHSARGSAHENRKHNSGHREQAENACYLILCRGSPCDLCDARQRQRQHRHGGRCGGVHLRPRHYPACRSCRSADRHHYAFSIRPCASWPASKLSFHNLGRRDRRRVRFALQAARRFTDGRGFWAIVDSLGRFNHVIATAPPSRRSFRLSDHRITICPNTFCATPHLPMNF